MVLGLALAVLVWGAQARAAALPGGCEESLQGLSPASEAALAGVPNLLAYARFLDAKTEFTRSRAARLSSLIDKRHAPLLLDTGHPTEVVVVIMHGLYDSPYAQRDFAKALRAKGINVVVPLLPNHWEKDPGRMDKVSYQDFIAEEARAIEVAKKLGKKVVLYGHSAGGLLAADAALKDPSIAGLVLAAPALELTTPFSLITTVGAFFGADANTFTGEKPDRLYVPFYSAHAGDEIRKMSENLRDQWGWEPLFNFDREGARAVKQRMYSQLKMPVMILSAASDPVADNDEMDLMLAAARGPTKRLRVDDLDHSQVGVLPASALKSDKVKGTDAAHRRVWKAITGFLSENYSLKVRR